MSVEAIISEIEEKLGKLSGLPPDLSEQYDKLRDEFAKKQKPATKAAAKPAAKGK